MSPRAPRPQRPLHREPLVVALVLLNIGLGSLLLRRKMSERPGLPPGHPDVPMPQALTAEENLPPGHPDGAGASGENALGSGAGNPAMATSLWRFWAPIPRSRSTTISWASPPMQPMQPAC